MARVVTAGALTVGLIGAACGSQDGYVAEPASSPPVLASEPPLARPPAVYRVDVADEGDRLAVALSVDATGDERRADLPESRDRPERRAAVDGVRCGDRAVPRSDTGWRVPGDCQLLRYDVRLAAPPAAGLDPWRLGATHDTERSQWLLPGASVFVAPADEDERPALELHAPAGMPIHLALAGASRLGLQLPPRRSLGRVLLGFGAFPTVERSDGQTTYLHHFDVADAVPLDGIERGVAYLQAVTNVQPRAPVHTYWLGRDKDSVRRLTGRAFSNAIVVGYWRNLPDDAPESTRRAPLAVFFHQFFVSLAGPSTPDWVAQSLGQYFALRAWQEAGAIDEAGLTALLRTGAAAGPEETVLEAHARWAIQGSDDAWSEFYSVGLGFWMALDAHLARASGGAKRLDDVAAELLALFYDAGGRPPMQFLSVLAEAGAPDASLVTSRWLGWPGSNQ